MTLDEKQIAQYQDEGYLVLREVLSKDEAEYYRAICQHEGRTNAYPDTLKYPTPGKYTVGGNRLADAGLAPMAEHPGVVSAVEDLLGGPSYLTAYVAYLRSPGDTGGGAHCDYKRWRPVGSSLNWLFAIVPLTDFDENYGPLACSPGSHRQESVIDRDAHVWDVTPPDKEKLPEFVDPELKAGDLLLMNGHTWHYAPPGLSKDDRIGFFHKYCAINAPPAAGYYPYNTAAYDALSDEGKRLLPDHYDEPLATTRLLVEDTSSSEPKYLLLNNGDGRGLPGGEGCDEDKVGWDVGARIGSMQEIAKDQLGVEVPWMSYIEDVKEGDGLSRLYAYPTEGSNLDIKSGVSHDWLTLDQLKDDLGPDHEIAHAIETWRRDDIIRGVGKAISQSKRQFEKDEPPEKA